MKKIILLLVIAAVAAAGYFFYKKYSDAREERQRPAGFRQRPAGSHRGQHCDKLAGRIEEVMVNEGDFVTRGQPLARMQTNVLEAQLAQAQAQHSRAVTAEASARATIEVRLSEKEAAKAVVLQKKSGLDGARKRYERLKLLDQADATSKQQYEDAETAFFAAEAELAAAQASLKQADAAIEVAKAEAAGAAAALEALRCPISPAFRPTSTTAFLRRPAKGASNTASPSPAKCFPPAAGC